MKKKVIFGAVACTIAALSVVGLNTNKTNSSNVTLSDLMIAANADAEGCDQSLVREYSPDGHCVFGFNFCIFSCGPRECDPFVDDRW